LVHDCNTRDQCHFADTNVNVPIVGTGKADVIHDPGKTAQAQKELHVPAFSSKLTPVSKADEAASGMVSDEW
jgi:hypothetical protein